ncbi:M23 family metallopeptidase [Cryobacterium melibiosiphilum]|uniref:M23 family metallopeptidase n=1 Tax=Cryobacterium melibiosiphilum TaxID=995039 RepID=A0A3A5MML7_9MICO|nr:M23 family metallopeptidase [Cryobacterium melibiosiphilum]RJT88133.1 M23 family metallopeptidase [Cryobacterium melibiosiphilum]
MIRLIRPANKEPGRRYGDRPVSGVSTIRHLGNDYGWGSGYQIYAAAAGVVQFVRWSASTLTNNRSGGYGNYIIVNHGSGIQTLYAHLPTTAPRVHVGQQVHAGQLIALMGNTGNASGAHLHFEVRINGSITDPNPYISGTASTVSVEAIPITVQKVEDDMFTDADRAALHQAAQANNLPVLVRTPASPKVWLSNLVTRRLVDDEGQLAAVQSSLAGRGLDSGVNTVAALDVFGVAVLTDAEKATLTAGQIAGTE